MRIGTVNVLIATLFIVQGCLAAAEQIKDSCTGTSCQDTNNQTPCCKQEQGASCLPCLTSKWTKKEASLVRTLFTDFSGRQFTFGGDEDESYNLFTEADHQLNAILANEDHSARQIGVTLRGVGIHGPDTAVKISLDTDLQIAVTVNDRAFKDEATRLDGVIVTRGCTIAECVNASSQTAVNVKDRFLVLTAWIVPSEGKEPASLAFKASVMERPMSQVHGVLGQTLEADQLFDGKRSVSMPSNLQFYGEGQISDYSTTDLFSSDSTFSIFTRKAERRRQKRKRQMLEGNALASMAFAAKNEAGFVERRRFPK